ncbi:uncharacterized protein PSFLO_02321 [Pseudozyma flocculosa]|uniref:HypA-like protein n=1 Tax=Pseudozyma flocculosa TaxID=84751 RepID=A0A5C3EYA2_9BASI|nr:uncharacterized protein PSFLO_02321 [Pseudozyma flocculosa]
MSTAAAAANHNQDPATKAFTPSPSKLEVFAGFQRGDDVRTKIAQILNHNHEKHHCFFNDKGFHNHSAHQILADYAIGATAEQLDAHYEYQLTHDLATGYKFGDRSRYDPYYQDPASPAGAAKGEQDAAAAQRARIEKITSANWTDHLGNPRYYWSYLHFFREQLESRGLGGCLEHLVLSDEANKDGRHMLARYLGGVIHGLIHFGYGAEFQLLPIAAEGLAMTTSTGLKHQHLFPPGWTERNLADPASAKRLVPLMKEMLDDDRLSPEALGLTQNDSGLPDEPFEQGGKAVGLINDYADRWSLTAGPAADGKDIDLDAVVADLAWFSVLVLGAVPKQGKYYKHDFFLMHANNAHIYTRTVVPLLSRESQQVYLRGVVRYFLYFWIARGRPRFSTANWKAESDAAAAVGWERIFGMARADDDEHLPKAVRALYFYSHHISSLPPAEDDTGKRALCLPGLFDRGADTDTDTGIGGEDVDVEGMMYHQMGGEDRVSWDFHGFYPDVPADAPIGR